MAFYTKEELETPAGEQFIRRVDYHIELYIRGEISFADFMTAVSNEQDYYDGVEADGTAFDEEHDN